ncbi:Hypothetical protein PBC10988_41120 [Planctomycetales bacterium 10988]|nr:Hypothetical protein PBC10988_41120 [Planctomycetales bacterium 10988]
MCPSLTIRSMALLGGWMLSLAMLPLFSWAQAPDAQPNRDLPRLAQKENDNQQNTPNQQGFTERKQYYLGIEVEPIPAELTEKYSLPADNGFLIQKVTKEGPAHKAGVQRFDILQKVDGNNLPDIGSLAKLIQSSEGKALTLTVLRWGESQEIKVVPQVGITLEYSGYGPVPQFWEVFTPGAVRELPQDDTQELPEDVTISLSKTGKNPLQIEVTRGKESWKLSSDELEKLPEDLLPIVLEFLSNPMGDQLHHVPRLPGGKASAKPDFDLEKKMEEMRKQLEKRQREMQDELKQLLESHRKMIEENKQKTE